MYKNQQFIAILVLFLSLKALSGGLSVTVYSDSGQFAEQTVSLQVNDRYQVLHRGLIDHFRHSNCETLLAHQEEFSLRKMADIEYITPQQMAGFSKLPAEISFSQVAFIENFSEVAPAKSTPIQSSTFFRLQDQKNYATRATLRLVSGQVIDPEQGLVQKTLPWLLDPDFVGQSIDRNKYPLVWEMGRAAQTQPRDIQEAIRRLIALAYMETRLHRVDPAQALLTVHSLDEAHTRAYKRFYPFLEVVTLSKNDTNNVILGAGLDKILKVYPPELHIEALGRFIEIGRGQIDLDMAIDFLLLIPKLARIDYDVLTRDFGNERRPIILRPPTVLVEAAVQKFVAERVADPAIAQAVKVYMATLPIFEGNRALDYIYDPNIESIEHLQHTGMLIFSNIDEAAALKDLNYLKLVYAAVYLQAKELFNQYLTDELDQATKDMIFDRMAIGFQSSSYPLLQHSMQLKPSVSTPIQWRFERGFRQDGTIENQLPVVFQQNSGHTRKGKGGVIGFKSTAIKEWLDADPTLYKKAQDFLKVRNYRLKQIKNDMLAL